MRYKQSPLLSTMILLVLLFTFSQGFKNAAGINVPENTTPGFAVIELFTSEGCSSCHSADAAVEKFLKENNQQVYVLAFHVDYWNKLGWKDIFSNAAYTARQNKYATVLGLESIYTPQIIVNGRYEFVGSNSSQLKRQVDKALTNSESKLLTLTAVALPNNHVALSYQLNEKTIANLKIGRAHV